MSFFSDKSSFKLRRDQSDEPAPVAHKNSRNVFHDESNTKSDHQVIEKSTKLALPQIIKNSEAAKIGIGNLQPNQANERVQNYKPPIFSTAETKARSKTNFDKERKEDLQNTGKVRNKSSESNVAHRSEATTNFAGLTSSPAPKTISTLTDSTSANSIQQTFALAE